LYGAHTPGELCGSWGVFGGGGLNGEFYVLGITFLCLLFWVGRIDYNDSITFDLFEYQKIT